ncbi:DUF3169 family protein [Paenibacillus eucommiae]|uniref:Membrane protein n=1 Tax=Paenibacillus eucommiae TaxID=1355755 RepID=A0ABS4J5A2_9BACL|nr:DUF3169 family protein [Paenibacillus eucommiae]MBP1994465.1 putative membrane protein [Paenibacillus eucommiae]
MISKSTQTGSTKKKKNTLLILLSMIIGGIIGYLFSSGLLKKVPEDIQVTPSIYFEYDVLFAVIALVSIVLTVWNASGLLRLSRIKDQQSSEHDEPTSPKERLLGTLLKISTYNFIISFVWISLAFAHTLDIGKNQSPPSEETFMLTTLLTAVLFLFISVFLQVLTVNRYNKQYPDRQLDLSALHAQRDHFEKLDEGEKYIAYRSSYRAFRVVNILLMAGILFFIMYALMFSFSPLPIIVLAIIWIVQNAVYYREVSKLEG